VTNRVIPADIYMYMYYSIYPKYNYNGIVNRRCSIYLLHDQFTFRIELNWELNEE